MNRVLVLITLRPVICVIAFVALGIATARACAESPEPTTVVRLVFGRTPLTSVAACAVDDMDCRKSAITPASWAELRALPDVDSQAMPPPAEFGGLPLETLSQAWTIALRVDHQLAAKQYSASAARQSLYSARAQRWPSVDLESGYNVRSDEPSFRIAVPPAPTRTVPYAQDEGFSYRAKIEIPLYTSGRIGHGVDAANARAVAAALDVTDSLIDLKMQVAEEYVDVLRTQREVEVTQSTVRSLQSHSNDVELLFRHRQVPQNDLLAAQVATSDAKQRATQATLAADSGHAVYNRRLGRPLTSPVRIAELPIESVVEDLELLTDRAVSQRPGIARLAARAESLRHQACSVRARNQPQVSLQGEYAFEENQFQSPNGIVGLGIGVKWNIYDGGRRRYEAAALLQQAEALVRTRVDLESWIALRVRQAWLQVRETRERIEVTAEAIQQAEENLRVSKRRYSLGVGTNTEVLDAERSRTESSRNHDNARFDAVLAVLRLRHATGDL